MFCTEFINLPPCCQESVPVPLPLIFIDPSFKPQEVGRLISNDNFDF